MSKLSKVKAVFNFAAAAARTVYTLATAHKKGYAVFFAASASLLTATLDMADTFLRTPVPPKPV